MHSDTQLLIFALLAIIATVVVFSTSFKNKIRPMAINGGILISYALPLLKGYFLDDSRGEVVFIYWCLFLIIVLVHFSMLVLIALIRRIIKLRNEF